MAKARSFSIYLLKADFASPDRALKSDHDLKEVTATDGWPTYLASRDLDSPWWRSYFGITDAVSQGFAGAVVFVEAGGRTFALTFGHTAHNLRDEAYEYDFGLRTTLNAVEPGEIRNTDELDPSTSRRRRTQLPEHADLTYFDFDGDSSVLRSLTGAIRPEYRALFSHATGASNLRVSAKQPRAELTALLKSIYEVYQQTTYTTAFPDANNIQPVRDPLILDKLNDKLLESVAGCDDALVLTIPELVSFQDDFEVSFAGVGRSELYSDVSLDGYFGYVTAGGAVVAELSLDDLRRHKLNVVDTNQVTRATYSIYRSLVFETTLDDQTGTFHLSEGTWYRVADDYLARLTEYLEPVFAAVQLPARTTASEYAYNDGQLVPHWPGSVLLDKSNTSPKGQTAVEPCDVARVEGDDLVLTHVKLGVKASDLSHLFSQGVTSVELLSGEVGARDRLKELVLQRDATFDVTPIDKRSFRVEYVIVTKKDAGLGSAALPLFSRISLRRAHRTLTNMRVPVRVMLAGDEVEVTTKPKPRKPRKPRARSASASGDDDK